MRDGKSKNEIGNIDFWYPVKEVTPGMRLKSRHELFVGDYSERAAGAFGSLVGTFPSSLWDSLPPSTLIETFFSP